MLSRMRTTLTLDDDILTAARALAEQRGVPIGSIISDLARQSLSSTHVSALTRNGIRLLPVRQGSGPVTPALIKRLMEEHD